MKKLQTLDEGYSKELNDRKQLAHRFSLGGTSFIGEQRIELEGISPYYALHELVIGIDNYYAILKTALTSSSDEAWKAIIARLPATSRSQVESLNKDDLLNILEETKDALVILPKIKCLQK